MKFLTALSRFWYDFIIGDDWKIAVAVVLALCITGGVMAAVHSSGGSLSAWTVLGGCLVLALFLVGLLIDARPKVMKK